MPETSKDFTNDTIIHVKNPDGFEYIQFRKLLEYGDILTHAFTTRKGGLCKESFDSLDLAAEGDNRDELMENHKIVCRELKVDFNNMVRTHQVHGDLIRKVDKRHRGEGFIRKLSMPAYDGLMTNEMDTPIKVIAADCNMLLFFDPVQKVIAAIHSGWKGTVLNIAGKAIREMQQYYNSEPNDIIIAIGPSIRECCFEFGLEGIELFGENFITRKHDNQDKIHVDLTKIITEQLIEAGVKAENILDSKICTMCNHDYFFSYRHTGPGKTGRHAGFIELKQ